MKTVLTDKSKMMLIDFLFPDVKDRIKELSASFYPEVVFSDLNTIKTITEFLTSKDADVLIPLILFFYQPDKLLGSNEKLKPGISKKLCEMFSISPFVLNGKITEYQIRYKHNIFNFRNNIVQLAKLLKEILELRV